MTMQVPSNGLYVEVYWNLHKNIYSVRHKGLVVYHGAQFVIDNPKFIVQAAGRAKVLEEQRKNVHAFVRGNFRTAGHPVECLEYAKYNPYQADHFFDYHTEEPLYEAKVAYMTMKEDKPRILYGV